MITGFSLFMAMLTWLHPQKFWCIYTLVLGVAVQMGYQIGMLGTIVWLGVGKVLNDLIYAGRES